MTTIAFVGTPECVEPLRHFLWDQFEGEVDIATFQALIATPSVMGTIQSADVVEQLTLMANPKSWEGIRWSFGECKGRTLWVQLSKSAINGLGYCESPRAGEALAELKLKPYEPEQVMNIDQGVKNHAEVRAKGFAEFAKGRNRGD